MRSDWPRPSNRIWQPESFARNTSTWRIYRRSLLRRQRRKHKPQAAVVRLGLISRVPLAIDDAEFVREFWILARSEALIHAQDRRDETRRLVATHCHVQPPVQGF